MKLVVPYDFTPVADNAVLHATNYARSTKTPEVILLHILERSGSARNALLDEVLERLRAIATKFAESQKVTCVAEVREGTLSDEIADYVDEVQADIVVMGTHGIKGIQRLIGSKAIRVVTGSNVPFLVVQQPPAGDGQIHRILMPLGARAVEKEKLTWAVQQAEQTGASICVLIEYYSDNELVSRRNTNVILMRRLFESSGIQFEEHQIAKGASLKNEIETYAKELKADMILIMITQSTIGLNPMLNSTDQDIMANSLGLPVFCVNPSML